MPYSSQYQYLLKYNIYIYSYAGQSSSGPMDLFLGQQ